MKKNYLYIWFVLAGLLATLSSCDENDPFNELGKVTSEKVPFVTTSGIENLYAADDTIFFNVFYWAAADNIDKLILGKGEIIEIAGSLSIDDGGGPVSVNIAFTIEKEMLQVGADIPHNPLDYETARNAYNRAMSYHIDPGYQLLELEDPANLAAIDAMAHALEIKQSILEIVHQNGVLASSWEELQQITMGVDLKLESTLTFQVIVADAGAQFNHSQVTAVKVGALE